MPSSSRLLGRLLLVAGPAALVACGARSEPLDTTPPLLDVGSEGGNAGQSGNVQSGQGGAGQGGAGQGGAGTGGASGAAQAGSAGSAGTTLCYQIPLTGDPAPPPICDPITALGLPAMLAQFPAGNCESVSQVLSGPVETTSGATLSCCYQCLTVNHPCGTGRPLLVGDEARVAGLVRGGRGGVRGGRGEQAGGWG
jgi:hypothetical protein